MPKFKFPSTGVEVEIHPVSMVIIMDIAREWEEQNPKPEPKTERVQLGNGNYIEEYLYSDPEYKFRMEQWQQRHNKATELESMEAYIQLGVRAQVDQEALNRIREYYRRFRKTELGGDDHYVYVRYCLLNTTADYEGLVTAIQEYSHATEQGVTRALAAFQPVG